MCRWNAYFGRPLLIDELLYRPKHGLIDQSLHSRMGAETTNGDGFGLGWYGAGDGGIPGRYRSVSPAWNDANLRDLAGHIESPLFLAHIRATSGTPVQQTNCHPFRHGRWLFVHNVATRSTGRPATRTAGGDRRARHESRPATPLMTRNAPASANTVARIACSWRRIQSFRRAIRSCASTGRRRAYPSAAIGPLNQITL